MYNRGTTSVQILLDKRFIERLGSTYYQNLIYSCENCDKTYDKIEYTDELIYAPNVLAIKLERYIGTEIRVN